MERYFYRISAWNGEFRKVGANWEEYQNQVKRFSFVEVFRNPDWVTFQDVSRGISVQLPVGGGQSYYLAANVPGWTPLYMVDRMERDFTQVQRSVLSQDCQMARARLDRVIARLAEREIMPTPKVHEMQVRVKNIFHINLVDPNPADLMTEVFFFANLLSNYKTLRSSGFDQDPPFRFEPDYKGNLIAWVIGVDDPTVHISPSHFYMDRDQMVLTLIHERSHTVLRLQGHPPETNFIPIHPADGDPQMTRDDAMKNPYCYEWLSAAMQK